MSLHVNAPAGLGQHAEQQLHATWETLDDVMVTAMKEGFGFTQRPIYRPPVLHPQWLDDLTPERYHLLIAQYSAWKTYSHSRMNTLDAGILECDNEMKILEPSIRQNIRISCQRSGTKKPAEAVIKDMVLTNPRYQELLLKKQVAQQTRLIVEPDFERFSRELRALSRSLEMRRQELETSGRGDARGERRPDF